MSINFCTISSSAVDSFCGNRRAIVLNNLINELRPPVPSTQKHRGQTLRRPWNTEEKWEAPVAPPTELERIVVSATFQDLSGEVWQDVDQRLDLVTVTDIHVEPTTVSVNISDLVVH